jgi:hypothetical protein
MPRWRQCSKTHKLIPIDQGAMKADGHFVQGDIQAFVSPIDGRVISDRKQLAEHNKRHGVVNSAEFSDEFLAKARKKREDFYQGKKTTAESFAAKQEIHEVINYLERQR